MSSGPFINSRYETNKGTVHRIRIQPETQGLSITGAGTNGPAAGAIDTPGSAVVSRGKRAFGINARTVTIRFPGTVEGYLSRSPIRLPVMSPTLWNSIIEGQIGTYLGNACEVIGKGAETIK